MSANKNEAAKENLIDTETRARLAGRVEVLDKVKELFLLPQLDMMTAEQVAEYYEVDKKAIEKCYERNREEIRGDGAQKYSLSELLERFRQDVGIVRSQYYTDFNLSDDITLRVPNVGINLFSKRSVLRIGMLLRDSPIAREVRSQLLNEFEKTDDAKKVEDIETEQEAMGQMGIAFVNGDIEAFCEAAMKYTSFKQKAYRTTGGKNQRG